MRFLFINNLTSGAYFSGNNFYKWITSRLVSSLMKLVNLLLEKCD